jgi:molybdopterin molybdotransferase
MEIQIQITDRPIAEKIRLPGAAGTAGAWIEFRGVVRARENGQTISALEYEAYPEMATREMRRLLESLAAEHPCLAARVIHRVGTVPVGETAIYVGVAAAHRAEAIGLIGKFMDQLKKDVPIWKRRALSENPRPKTKVRNQTETRRAVCKSLDEAILEIQSRCRPLPAVRVPLEEAFGRVLRETVLAVDDLPPFDCSTRDGYAIRLDDGAESFEVVDTVHAADWKPRQLESGQAVRVATGAPLPCDNLRVVMQENVERDGHRIKLLKREAALNLRKRGGEVKAGQPLLQPGVRLNAGRLALLAGAGCVQPLVGPRLRVGHFTTGDEIVPPGQPPRPGQIRDSNSILMHGLLQEFTGELEQKPLQENFEAAWAQLDLDWIERADVLLISGGASVGEKDFTRALLERLRFEIIFAQVNVRPGRPLIFGVNGSRLAFGLPGNPLSHFAVFHFAVAPALARLTGGGGPAFFPGKLAAKLADEPCPRETLWPARQEWLRGEINLHPLPWASSGDLTCLAETNALIRVPANQGSLAAGSGVDFLPAGGMFGG